MDSSKVANCSTPSARRSPSAKVAMAAIWETSEWAALQSHADSEIAGTHLRDLMKVFCCCRWNRCKSWHCSLRNIRAAGFVPQDEARCAALQAEFEGINLDFSRQRVTPATMVRKALKV